MTTALISHPDCLQHVTPPGHPERVARLEVILQALQGVEFYDLRHVKAPLAPDDDLIRVHPIEYVRALRDAAPDAGWVSLDADTHMSPGSLDAALRAAGANLKAVDMVLSGEVANAFCAVRPPGHHAERATPMGFCLFGSVAMAAKYALDHHGLERVAIVDFDVHHGNGTQDLVEDDPRILFVSTHQMPLYPGTGRPDETGVADNVMNLPLKPNAGGAEFRAAIEGHALPKVRAFKPELILVSAGFDAHYADPLAQLNLRTEDFTWVTQRICDLADELCEGRVVSSLEGGYDLDALAEATAAHVRVLMERGK